MATIYRIHPAIGVARLGNSTTAIMLAPEAPQELPTELVEGEERPIETFRDAEGRIKREAARFRVFAYDGGAPDDRGREILAGSEDVLTIEWTVWLANKKASWYEFDGPRGESGYDPDHPPRNSAIQGEARRQLIIDPGPQTVSGVNDRAEFRRGGSRIGYPQIFPPSSLRPFAIDSLGEARTDDRGRLLVLAGFGHSGSSLAEPMIGNYANNDGWFDDTADGPVTATLVMSDGSRIPVDEPAWVIAAAPSYAPQVGNVVTLYDVVLDLNIRHFGTRPELFGGGQWQEAYTVDFRTEVLPFLQRAERMRWVEASIPQFSHLFDWLGLGDPSPETRALRERVFGVLRPPDAPNATTTADGARQLMPLLLGDDPYESPGSHFLTVTPTRYFLLSQWAKGRFTNDESATRQETPGQQLDRAALENCVGGPFFPGIEVTWIARNPSIYAAPFRIRHRGVADDRLRLDEDLEAGLEPGDLTKRMALPWQADFYECFREDNSGIVDVPWWPAQRPLTVLTPDFQEVEWTRGFARNTQMRRFADLQMVKNWCDLGFLKNVQIGSHINLVEVERNDAAIRVENPPLSV